MKYHVTLARNDVIGEFAGSRSSCSLDNFDEPCTVKKRTGTPSFCKLCKFFSVFLLDSNDSTFLEIYFRQSILKKGISGAVKYLASTLYLFVKK